MRRFAHFATLAVDAFHNVDYDQRTNGELRAVSIALSGLDAPIVFDVGANHGDWARLAVEMNASAQIHCFEISAATRQLLQGATRDLAQVTVAPSGLDREPGTVPVKRYASMDGHTSIYDYPHRESADWTDEPVTTGDAYLAEKGIEHVAFLKIDTEGAEHRVLAGFETALRSGVVDVVQFEYGRANIYSRFLLADFHEFFSERNYVVGKLFPRGVDFRGYHPGDEDFRGPNYLAVHRDRGDLMNRLTGNA
ncbi:MAG TPA: FkbM family methyltransferase [Acidimicrobiales bacterium]|nr:FkbM family methyltransferase [Acidimicrobiales bacterium]